MEYGFVIMGYLLNFSVVFGHNAGHTIFLETKSKRHLYYVELTTSEGKVYEMGSYLDMAGSGYSIRRTETLTRDSEGIYVGKNIKIITENKKQFLALQGRKNTKLQLDTPDDMGKLNMTLNNAYYLDNFFSLCDELNKLYPLNHFSFRTGFYFWKNLEYKQIDHHHFRRLANDRLQEIEDSISLLQNYYSSLTNSLTQSIRSMEYSSLKDSIIKLPPGGFTSRYFGSVARELSKQQPEYFFRLAEDLPDRRDAIFMSVEENKQVIERLEAVEGHHQIKREFFKDRRFNKSMPYRIIGSLTLAAVAITYLIVRE